MLEFILTLLLAAILGLFFGKADTKKEILEMIGLDLSDENYENKKKTEFERYCKKAMKNAVTMHNIHGNNEFEFIANLTAFLEDTYVSRNSAALNLKMHYIEHAYVVAWRRENQLSSKSTPLIEGCDFTKKIDLFRYIDKLWEKYQNPWPKDWLKKDGAL